MKYLKLLTVLSLMMPPALAGQAKIPQDLPNPEIQKAILELTPDLEPKKAEQLSILISKAADQYKVEWWVLVAIFKQESNFNDAAVNWKSRDFGIGQFNYRTIQDRKIDLGKLLTNKSYAIVHSARYLSEIKAKYAKIDNRNGRVWFTRYHSFTPSLRTDYQNKLYKHFKVIKRLPDVGTGRKTHTSARGRSRAEETPGASHP